MTKGVTTVISNVQNVTPEVTPDVDAINKEENSPESST